MDTGCIEKFNIFGFDDQVIGLHIGCERHIRFEFDHMRFNGFNPSCRAMDTRWFPSTTK